MKRLGVIGGMSWESTQTYYRLLNEEIKARCGPLHSAPLLLWNMDFAPIARLQAEGDWAGLTTMMEQAAQGLRAGGAELLIIATNTMHLMADQVATAGAVPLIHIADATGGALREAGVQRPLLLATRFTMEKAFYREHVERVAGCRVVVPEEPHRSRVHEVIYEELVQGQIREESRAAYLAIIDHYRREQAIDAVIFGCTEVGLLLNQSSIDQAGLDLPAFDTTAIHCQAAAAAMLASPGD